MGELAVGFFSGTVGVFDTSDGSLKWENTYLDGENMGRGNSKISIDSDGNTYFGGFWEEDSWDGVTEHNVLVKYNSGGAKAWEKSGNFIIAELGPNEDYLYTGTYDTQTLHKVDVTDGSSVWTYSGPFDSGVYGVAVTDNGYVYVHDYNGNNAKLDTAGNEQFTNSLPFGNYPRIISEDGYLYWRGNKYDPADGQNMTAIWSSEAAEYLKYESGYLYGEGSNGGFVKVDAGDGSTVWVDSNVSSFRYGVGADSNGDFYYSDNNNFYKRSGSNKTQIWSNTNYGYPKSMMVRPVSNTAPTADYTYTKNGGTVDFTDQSSDSDGSIASYSWDFGDGTTSTSQSPSHTYSSSGTYTATLTVTDDAGATASTSQDVSVTTSISGTAALTDKGQTTSSAGTVANAGTGALTDNKGSLSLTGGLPLSTSLALTSKKESLSAGAQILNSGTAAFTDASTSILIKQKLSRIAPYIISPTNPNTNADGLSKWSGRDGMKVWNLTFNNHPAGSDADKDGRIYVSGDSKIHQVSPTGTVQWSWDPTNHGYSGTEWVFPDYPNTLPTGGVLFAVEERDTDTTYTNYLVQLNSLGDVTASTEVLSNYNDGYNTVDDLKVDANGNAYMIGTESQVIKKYDSGLNEKWSWSEASYWSSLDLAVRGDRLYYIGRDPNVGGDYQNVVYRISSAGTTDWISNYFGNNYTNGNPQQLSIGSTSGDIHVKYSREDNLDRNGSYYGRFEDTGTGMSQVWERQWYYDSSTASLTFIRADSENNVFAYGQDSSSSNDELERFDGGGSRDMFKTYAQNTLDIRNTTLQPLGPIIGGTAALTSNQEALDVTLTAPASASGSLTDTGQTLTGTAGAIVSGTNAVTDGKEGYASSGQVLVQGSNALTDKAAAPTGQGTPIVAATGALTDLAPAVALLGGPLASGSGSLTDKAQTPGLVGAALAAGAGAIASPGETLGLAGGPTAGGSAALTDRFGAPTGAGLIGVSGASALTSKGEIIFMEGDLYSGGSGDLAFTDGQTTITADGDILTTGESAVTDAGQVLSTEGVVLLSGTSSLTSKKETLASAGNVLASGSGGYTDSPTILLLGGDILSSGGSSLTLVDGLQSVSISGGPIAGGATSLEDRPGPFASQGEVLAASTLAVADEAYAPNGAGFVRASGSLRAGNPPNTTEGTGAVLTSGALSTEGGAPIITIATFVGRKPDSISIGVGSIISIETDVQSSLKR